MCFHLDHKEPRVATEDIEVFKFGSMKGDKFHPVWRGDFAYILHERTPDEKLIVCYDTISIGYHSYNKDGVDLNREFLHAVMKSRGLSTSLGLFIIPKGATYYTNPLNGEYVSSTIIFKGLTKLWH